MLKLNVWQGVCSSVRLDNDFFIGTSVFNCQTLKMIFLQIQVIKMIFSIKLGGILFSLYLRAKYELIWFDITAQTLSLGTNLLVKAQTIPENSQSAIFFDQNNCWVKMIEGEAQVENLRCGAAMVTKIVKNT